ncbi:hypothetical protein VTJ83DRAFT_3759 [Remersonia thermophila]|uniref:Zn(2)-C6 fungal-type domain-containing protein n=1 Tax=Remersonia thermophila TaxID=72144 RepID=A0ABR4DEX1_9PEZI
MRHTLRRSCAACARSKHSCDLATPRCSRCIKRNIQCAYANEPLTAPTAPATPNGVLHNRPMACQPYALTGCYRFAPVDPFESYPPTRLSRDHVQRLIHSFLHKIAFQYYPLDLDATTNPFLVSWWPIALGDPALFNVSLQTACLDEEMHAQEGFHTSELLMADSVALLRRKVEDTALAVQDGTMNSVITLATIEFGKGNIKVAEMHVNGVKKLVDMRGGISQVRQTSPLTARMVSWVSMLIMGHPQFDTQDDAGTGSGIPPIPEWLFSPAALHDHPELPGGLDIGREPANTLTRLHGVFRRASHTPLTSARLHDLTCFVIHRLLLTSSDLSTGPTTPLAEAIRYGIILFMFMLQGPTYFSHAVIFNRILRHFDGHLKQLEPTASITHPSMCVWLLAVGMAASAGTPLYSWIRDAAKDVAASLQLNTWDDVLTRLKSVLWLESRQSGALYRLHWDALFQGKTPENPPDPAIHLPRCSISSPFI